MGRDGAFYAGAIVGALIAVPAAIALFALATIGLSDVEWETLVAGAFATLGAAATVYMIRKQISASREEYYLSRSKRLFAARTMLSHALSDIYEYSDGLIGWVLSEGESEKPILSGEVFETIKEVIEYNEDKRVNLGLSSIVARIQILKARMGPIRGGMNSDDLLVDATELLALSEAFFEYARDGTKKPRELLNGARIRRIADFRGIEQERHPHFYSVIQARNYQNELGIELE